MQRFMVRIRERVRVGVVIRVITRVIIRITVSLRRFGLGIRVGNGFEVRFRAVC